MTQAIFATSTYFLTLSGALAHCHACGRQFRLGDTVVFRVVEAYTKPEQADRLRESGIEQADDFAELTVLLQLVHQHCPSPHMEGV